MATISAAQDEVSEALARHFLNDLILGWHPSLAGNWAVYLSNGQRIDLDAPAVVQAFLYGLESAHQAGRGHGRGPRGDACRDCGAIGTAHAMRFH